MALPSCFDGFSDGAADVAHLRVRTLTPIYTGGVGQRGDQLHPSGLLGSVRAFSALVANAVGDSGFEDRVWGNAGSSAGSAIAKRVALRLETQEVHPIRLPDRIFVRKRDPNQRDSTWYFNKSDAYEGPLGLVVRRLGISDDDWNMLMLSLRIQARHATFCAKDQFGLGVVDPETLPVATPLSFGSRGRSEVFSLLRCAFVDLELRPVPGNSSDDRTLEQRMKDGLEVRALLRACLRPSEEAGSEKLGEDPQADSDAWTSVRHRLMGSLGESASGIDVSAAFRRNGRWFVRLFVRLWLEGDSQETLQNQRQASMKRIATALRTDGRFMPIAFHFGGSQKDPPQWINQLAGV